MKPGTRELLGAILDIANAALADTRRRVDGDGVVPREDRGEGVMSTVCEQFANSPRASGRA